MRRILLGQLGANGDCLYATILARQIRHDFPDAHITWAISQQCAGLLRNNPHIDEVWPVPLPDGNQQELAWRVFEREATRRLLRHEFDRAYLSQIWPNNFQNYDGTIRPSLLRAYGAPITVPIENVIELDEQEEANIKSFVDRCHLDGFQHRILFECSARSGQSFITPALAQQVADHLYRLLPSTSVLFSTHLPMTLEHPNSRYAGAVSLRESGALTRYCTLFVGAGSGGTVAATSTAAKSLPMLQLLAASTSVYASFAHDFEYFGLPAKHIVEMTNEDPAIIARAIATACTEGIEAALAQFGGRVPVRFAHYQQLIRDNLLRQERFLDAAQSLRITAARYGWKRELLDFGRQALVPNLARDADWIHVGRRREGEELLSLIGSARYDEE
jgi:hypothetical protein